jgi:hypothetical protein
LPSSEGHRPSAHQTAKPTVEASELLNFEPSFFRNPARFHDDVIVNRLCGAHPTLYLFKWSAECYSQLFVASCKAGVAQMLQQGAAFGFSCPLIVDSITGVNSFIVTHHISFCCPFWTLVFGLWSLTFGATISALILVFAFTKTKVQRPKTDFKT